MNSCDSSLSDLVDLLRNLSPFLSFHEVSPGDWVGDVNGSEVTFQNYHEVVGPVFSLSKPIGGASYYALEIPTNEIYEVNAFLVNELAWQDKFPDDDHELYPNLDDLGVWSEFDSILVHEIAGIYGDHFGKEVKVVPMDEPGALIKDIDPVIVAVREKDSGHVLGYMEWNDGMAVSLVPSVASYWSFSFLGDSAAPDGA